MINTPSAPAEIGAPSETVTSAATELNSSRATTLTKAPISTQCTATNNTLAAISAMSEGNPPKVCFLFGAGAEAYYGMPLGARFAVEIFRRQDQGKLIFTEIRNHVLQQLDPKPDKERTNAQLQYLDFLPDNRAQRIYTLSSNSAGVIIRELIQEHYEDISKFFREFGSKEEWVLKQLLNEKYDLHALLCALGQILGLPAPDTKSYSTNPVAWAQTELASMVQQLKSKNFFTMLPKFRQNEIIADKAKEKAAKNEKNQGKAEKSDTTETPKYSGERFRPVRMTHRPCEENASKKELFEAIYGLNSHISSRSHHCEALCL